MSRRKKTTQTEQYSYNTENNTELEQQDATTRDEEISQEKQKPLDEHKNPFAKAQVTSTIVALKAVEIQPRIEIEKLEISYTALQTRHIVTSAALGVFTQLANQQQAYPAAGSDVSLISA